VAVSKKISESAIRRLSLYLRILENLERDGEGTISSEQLAKHSDTTAAQVRKDLSLFGSFGKRGLGYGVVELGLRLRSILGLDRRWRVALVGVGRIGSALVEYGGFQERGYDIVAILDVDPSKVGERWADLTVRDIGEFEAIVRERDIEIVILAVPVEAVPLVMDRVTDAGVRGILNFAPTTLRVPEGVTVKDVNMVMELEALSFALSREEGEE
jgi:redox-sensing transcriptional repressor